jgi:hypothetical protein
MKYLIWGGPKTYWTFETAAELKQFIDQHGWPGPTEDVYKLHKMNEEHLALVLKMANDK